MIRLKKIRAFKKMFLTPEGKFKPEASVVLEDLLNFSHFWRDMGPEPYALAMREGRRQVLQRLLKFLKTDETILLSTISMKGENHEF